MDRCQLLPIFRCRLGETILADGLCVFQAFLSAATAVRCTAPCSISTCYTTAAITHYKPPSVLAPAKSVIEDEVRRNTFWIGEYMPDVDDNRTHLTDGYP